MKRISLITLLYFHVACISAQNKTEPLLYPAIAKTQMQFASYMNVVNTSYIDESTFEQIDTVLYDAFNFIPKLNGAYLYSKANQNYNVNKDSLFLAVNMSIEIIDQAGERTYESVYAIYKRGKRGVYNFLQLASDYSGHFYKNKETDFYGYSNHSLPLDVYQPYKDPVYTSYSNQEIKYHFESFLNKLDSYKLNNYAHSSKLCELLGSSSIIEMMITGFDLRDKPNEILVDIHFQSAPCFYNDEHFVGVFKVIHTFPIPSFYLSEIKSTDNYVWKVNSETNKKELNSANN